MSYFQPVDSDHIAGFALSYNSTTVLNVGAGDALASDDSRLIIGTGTTIDITTDGAGGLLSYAAAAEAAHTLYAVWVLEKDDGTQTYGFDTSFSSPTYPTDYTTSRRIGCWYNNAASDLQRAHQFGRGREQEHYTMEGLAAAGWYAYAAVGNAPNIITAPTAVSCPAGSQNVVLKGYFESYGNAAPASRSGCAGVTNESALNISSYSQNVSVYAPFTFRPDPSDQLYIGSMAATTIVIAFRASGVLDCR